MNTLIEAIEAVLLKYDLSDRQFCLKLDIEPSTWSRVKTGERKPSADFLGCLSSKFPELDYQIASYLKTIGDNHENGSLENRTDASKS